ncbi:helix-turn-helix domain-containing protein [Patulibacter defluvii]|uniref:helix-turn-helix domain-containing protein n=1 Tax=Patulibacter defluvii TaxID=3095358 RepID=UPI002A755878|nr:helix-turn-helix domain-containing protein [Patulibacter sp. DM4]
MVPWPAPTARDARAADGAAVPPVRVTRVASGGGWWALHERAPDPRLAHLVHEYQGYEEHGAGRVVRRALPGTRIPMIVSFDAPWEIGSPGTAGGRMVARRAFTAGLHDRYAINASEGDVVGMQFDLTPLGAATLLGVPMHELTGRVVDLDELLGDAVALLIERLADAGDWPARFAILDAVLLRRAAACSPASPDVAWAWRRLQESGGTIAVATLVEELRCSPRHLSQRFREQIGMSPKRVARVLRFERAIALLARDDGHRFGQIASACGYYDQAHMNRDFRAFSGGSPGDFLARVGPAGDVHDAPAG